MLPIIVEDRDRKSIRSGELGRARIQRSWYDAIAAISEKITRLLEPRSLAEFRLLFPRRTTHIWESICHKGFSRQTLRP